MMMMINYHCTKELESVTSQFIKQYPMPEYSGDSILSVTSWNTTRYTVENFIHFKGASENISV